MYKLIPPESQLRYLESVAEIHAVMRQHGLFLEKNMKLDETIIIAGRDRKQVHLMRRHWGRSGYSSIPCRTIMALIEELEVLPTCGVSVPLVIILPQILLEAEEYWLDRLSKSALDVPFVLVGDMESEQHVKKIFQRICKHRVPFDPNENPCGEALKKAHIKVENV